MSPVCQPTLQILSLNSVNQFLTCLCTHTHYCFYFSSSWRREEISRSWSHLAWGRSEGRQFRVCQNKFLSWAVEAVSVGNSERVLKQASEMFQVSWEMVRVLIPQLLSAIVINSLAHARSRTPLARVLEYKSQGSMAGHWLLYTKTTVSGSIKLYASKNFILQKW